MSPTDDSQRFASTEEYYARYRPRYGDAAIDYLRDRFGLDDTARVLDLGCGAGQLTIPLTACAGAVVGMDPNEEMLRWAQKQAAAAGRENVEWVVGSDADLRDDLGPFRLTTMGRSFHWMDQERTLGRLYRMTEPGGGVALVTDEEWLTKGTAVWQDEVYAVAAEYLDDLPERTGPVEHYADPWDELLESFEFTDVETATFDFEREWDVESVVGYVFSLSFCSPRTFGDDREAFEEDLRARMRELDQPFVQEGSVEVISGRTPSEASADE
jgi:ubiquinone/menaquinone biosynthesis C-methylase UbiE